MKNLTTKLSLLAVSSMLVATAAHADLARDTQITGTQYVNTSVFGQAKDGSGTFYKGSQNNTVGANDFIITDYNHFTSPADKATGGLVSTATPIVAGTSADVANASNRGFKSYASAVDVSTGLGAAHMPYTSVYKTFGGDTMTIGMVNGIANNKFSGDAPTSGAAVMGYASTVMKTTGSNGYKGDATITTLGTTAAANVKYGSANLDVNFANKTAQLHAKFQNADGTYRNIFVDNTISGNTFTGTGLTAASSAKKALMSSADQSTPFTVSGGFYGTNVGFAGGVFKNGSAAGSEVGTFGVTKVSKITPLVK